ncbi:diaminopimelate decarboxylase [Candidatus Woesearchaeota archaeon]|nr:diaminopimelate decarboxylase [Candidatus Woesearchaeota archaeon]
MVVKKVPGEIIERLGDMLERYPTPINIYHEKGMRGTIRRFNTAFSWVPGGFKNYFAVKAAPLPIILSMFAEEGAGTDCSSMPELIMSERVGITGPNAIFTSNDTPTEEFRKANEMGAIINLDDIEHIPILLNDVGVPETICFRFNPGKERTGNAIIGDPVEAKYGLTRKQIFEAYRRMKEAGSKRFGLHTMVASNELNANYFVETGRMLIDLVVELSGAVGIEFDFINLGGGVGVPYRPEQEEVDIEFVAGEIKKIYQNRFEGTGIKLPRIVMECGRVMTGPHAWLATTVRHVAEKHKTYVGLDACMADFARPGAYGPDCYHHITVLGKDNKSRQKMVDVTGSLCENCDKFAVDRTLPVMERGDIVFIYDTGAHGRPMGSNYNGKLRCGEVMLREDGSIALLRRPETIEEYLAPFAWPEG